SSPPRSPRQTRPTEVFRALRAQRPFIFLFGKIYLPRQGRIKLPPPFCRATPPGCSTILKKPPLYPRSPGMPDAVTTMSHNWAFAVFLLGVFGLIAFMLGLSSLLGSKAWGRSKNDP